MSIEIFTLPLAAGEVREADVTGEYFELRNAVSPIELIELLDRSGGVIARLANPEQSDYVRPGRYEKIRITNGPVAQTVRHFYGSGDAGSRRTSGLVQVEGTVATMGVVEVVDGGKARTLDGGAHIASINNVSNAGVVPSNILWNPAGSLRNLFIKSLRVSLGIAQEYGAGFTTNLGAGLEPPNAGNGHAPKKIGAASVAEHYVAKAAPFGGNTLGSSLATASLAANSVDSITYAEPLMLAPGQGFRVFGVAAASRLVTVIEYIEEAV